MSKPTKEAIEEAYRLAKEFVATHAREVSPLMLFPDEIANLIAHVRKRARDDALERAIVAGGIWVHADHIAQFNASLRALKDKPDGEQP